MKKNRNNYREMLERRNLDELRIVARKLSLRGFSKLTKSELISRILEKPAARIDGALDISLWDRARAKHFMAIFAIVCGIATLAGLYFTVWPNDSARQKEIVRITTLRDSLQTELDKEQARSHQLVRGVERAIGISGELALTNPEIARLSSQLRDALAQYDAKFSAASSNAIDDLELRLARATLANAEARYKDAAALITDSDLRRAGTRRNPNQPMKLL